MQGSSGSDLKRPPDQAALTPFRMFPAGMIRPQAEGKLAGASQHPSDQMVMGTESARTAPPSCTPRMGMMIDNIENPTK